MRESHVLRACRDYLDWGMNQGKWWYMRVNSGTVYPSNRDGSTRVVKLAPEGTADLLVIQAAQFATITRWDCSSVLWIETKHKRKQTESQKAFEAQVRAQGCDYRIVTDVDQLREVLE